MASPRARSELDEFLRGDVFPALQRLAATLGPAWLTACNATLTSSARELTPLERESVARGDPRERGWDVSLLCRVLIRARGFGFSHTDRELVKQAQALRNAWAHNLHADDDELYREMARVVRLMDELELPHHRGVTPRPETAVAMQELQRPVQAAAGATAAYAAAPRTETAVAMRELQRPAQPAVAAAAAAASASPPLTDADGGLTLGKLLGGLVLGGLAVVAAAAVNAHAAPRDGVSYGTLAGPGYREVPNASGGASNRSRCPGHGASGLQPFVTPRSGFHCDVCRATQLKGAAMMSCRTCNYDVCLSCFR